MSNKRPRDTETTQGEGEVEGSDASSKKSRVDESTTAPVVTPVTTSTSTSLAPASSGESPEGSTPEVKTDEARDKLRRLIKKMDLSDDAKKPAAASDAGIDLTPSKKPGKQDKDKSDKKEKRAKDKADKADKKDKSSKKDKKNKSDKTDKTDKADKKSVKDSIKKTTSDKPEKKQDKSDKKSDKPDKKQDKPEKKAEKKGKKKSKDDEVVEDDEDVCQDNFPTKLDYDGLQDMKSEERKTLLSWMVLGLTGSNFNECVSSKTRSYFATVTRKAALEENKKIDPPEVGTFIVFKGRGKNKLCGLVTDQKEGKVKVRVLDSEKERTVPLLNIEGECDDEECKCRSLAEEEEEVEEEAEAGSREQSEEEEDDTTE